MANRKQKQQRETATIETAPAIQQPAKQARMTALELKAHLRQQRRERRLAEKGY